MQQLSQYALPVCIVIILLWGCVRKIKVIDCFVEGAKTGVATVLDILPVLTALMVAVNMLRASGVMDAMNNFLSPAAQAVGIPCEVVPLCLIAPFSGSGAYAVLQDILEGYGPDSFVGQVASVICGASETTFYAISVYFGSAGISKTSFTLPCALCADAVSYITAAWSCRLKK